VEIEVAAEARCASGVLASIHAADIVIVAPSNPVASLGPMLALPGMRDTLRSVRDRTAVVTPSVESVPFAYAAEANRACSRAKLLKATGFEDDVLGAAALYAGLADTFVVDSADYHLAAEVERYDFKVQQADTLVHLGSDPRSLLEAILEPLATPSGNSCVLSSVKSKHRS
jgi:LPPG:FO 2-phospho-L-lactate transferase